MEPRPKNAKFTPKNAPLPMPRFAVLLIAFLTAFAAPAFAQDTPMADPPGDDPYTITGVPVDAKAKNGRAARDKAFAEGQKDALKVLAFRMTGESVAFKDVSDNAIATLVKSFEVEEGKSSGSRYVGKLAVHFKPEAAITFLESRGLRVMETDGPAGPGAPPALAAPLEGRILVLPVVREGARNVLWEEKTVWARAWENTLSDHPNNALLLPEGGMRDIGSISGGEAVSGMPGPLVRVMENYRARGVLVAALVSDATPRPDHYLKVQLAFFDNSGKLQGTESLDVPPWRGQTPSGWLENAARNAIVLWQEGAAPQGARQTAARDDSDPYFRRAEPMRADPSLQLDLIVPFSTPRQWQAVRRTLQEMPGVVDFGVTSLTHTRAAIKVMWRGTREEFARALAGRGLRLDEIPRTRQLILRGARRGGVKPAASALPASFHTIYPAPSPSSGNHGSVDATGTGLMQ